MALDSALTDREALGNGAVGVALGHQAEDLLLAPRSLSRGYFRPEAVRGILEEHASGARNHRLLIWSLMSFEHWNRIFVDREQVYR